MTAFRDSLLYGRQIDHVKFGCVREAAGQDVKYPARKRTVATSNKVPIAARGYLQ